MTGYRDGRDECEKRNHKWTRMKRNKSGNEGKEEEDGPRKARKDTKKEEEGGTGPFFDGAIEEGGM